MNSIAPLWLRVLAWLAFAAWVGTIFFLSSLSGPEILRVGIQVWDKAAHFLAFVAGGVVLALALRWSVLWPGKKIAVFALLILASYGGLDEVHQLFTPQRSGADLGDWVADCLGALAGVTLLLALYARYFRAPRPTAA